jgi:hypothetical protein
MGAEASCGNRGAMIISYDVVKTCGRSRDTSWTTQFERVSSRVVMATLGPALLMLCLGDSVGGKCSIAPCGRLSVIRGNATMVGVQHNLL